MNLLSRYPVNGLASVLVGRRVTIKSPVVGVNYENFDKKREDGIATEETMIGQYSDKGRGGVDIVNDCPLCHLDPLEMSKSPSGLYHSCHHMYCRGQKAMVIMQAVVLQARIRN